MKDYKIFFGFALGCLAATFINWGITKVRAQNEDNVIHVCVAADEVVRFVPGTLVCPSGEKSLALKKKDDLSDIDDKPKDDKKGDQTADKKTLDDLKQRLDKIESRDCVGIAKSRVMAPFEVYDKQNKTIFKVVDNTALLFDRNGKSVAEMRSDSTGGSFNTYGGDNAVTFGITQGLSGFSVKENNNLRISMGKDLTKLNSQLIFYSADGKKQAFIGQSTTNDGVAAVFDKDGVEKASMRVVSNKGLIDIYNGGINSLLELTEGNQGGKLSIFSSNGDPMVEAGVLPDDIGIVRTGPAAYGSGVGLLGLPGSYIMGKPQ